MLRFYFQNSTLICYLPLFTVCNLGPHISCTAALESNWCVYFWSHIPVLSRPLKPVCILGSWILAFYSYSLSDITCERKSAILSVEFVGLGSLARAVHCLVSAVPGMAGCRLCQGGFLWMLGVSFLASGHRSSQVSNCQISYHIQAPMTL